MISWPVLAALPFGRAALAAAIQAERLLLYGRALGLTDDQTREVVAAWNQTRVPLDWDRIRDCITLRAMGEEWRSRKGA